MRKRRHNRGTTAETGAERDTERTGGDRTSGERPRLTHVGVRVRWRHDVAACEVCGTAVHLDRRHHYAALSREPTNRARRTSDETVVFCERACCDRWCAQ